MQTAHRMGEAASDCKTAGKPAVRNRPSAWLWSWRVAGSTLVRTFFFGAACGLHPADRLVDEPPHPGQHHEGEAHPEDHFHPLVWADQAQRKQEAAQCHQQQRPRHQFQAPPQVCIPSGIEAEDQLPEPHGCSSADQEEQGNRPMKREPHPIGIAASNPQRTQHSAKCQGC